MVRFLALVFIALLVYLIVRSSLRGFLAEFRGGVEGGRRDARDELVKDPVCATYVPRRAALARRAGPETYYFCSPACAEKFKATS